MEFRVKTSDFVTGLNRVSKVIGGKTSSIPVLENYHLRIENKKAILVTSDSYSTAISTFPVEAEENISIAIPKTTIFDFVKNVSYPKLIFSIDERYNIKITTPLGEFDFVGQDGGLFPKIPTIDSENTLTLNSLDLFEALKYVLYSISDDENRKSLCGVYFDFTEDNELNIVSTNSNKLTKMSYRNIFCSKRESFLVHNKPLNFLQDVLKADKDKEIVIRFSENYICFEDGTNQLYCKLIDENFISYQMLLSNPSTNNVIADRVQFLNAVKRVSVFSEKN